MAIYHCVHRTVGRTTHAAGTAGAHARYVTRPDAARAVVGEHMPLGRDAAGAWLNDQERRDRKNARVIDKVTVALPRELDQAERVQLVRDFAAEVGEGRIPWLAGIHDEGEDRENPHAHVIFRDRDHETGKRAVGLSEKGSTEAIREVWERVTNQALERAGVEARVDRRSLEAQGIEREAGIHVGPNVAAMEAKGLRPESIPQETETGRVINWPEIDQGRTRPDRLREIQAANDLGRDTEDDRGRKEGAPPSDPVAPTSPAPADQAPDIDADRARWAQQLRDIAAQETARAQWMAQLREIAARDEAERARQTARDAAAVDPTASEPEAPLRPSQEPQEAVSRPEAPTPPGDRPEAVRQSSQERAEALASERGRLSAAIERGRQRLTSLGQRLEAAWDRITQRHANRLDPGGARVAGDPPEATQRASYEAENRRSRPGTAETPEIEMEEAEPGPQLGRPAPPPVPPPPPPPTSSTNQPSRPTPAEPALTPQALDAHPLLRRRRRVRGPPMPRL